MKAGKLPQDLLASLLERLPDDPRVLLGPGVGRDAAAVDVGDGRVLVAKADPVTLATDQIGSYAVHVNANDVACLGAKPSWFMATVFLPQGASEQLAETIFGQILSTCDDLSIVPVGGHTEITIGLDRPIVSGAMLGETTTERLVRPDGARPGDHVLLTNGIAIEGTAALAREAPAALEEAGVSEEIIGKAAQLLEEPGISVVRAAEVACSTGHVRALHDPTEGGLATALSELAFAAGLQAELRHADVPILPETADICAKLSLDPLGLLASGALLVVVDEASCDDVLVTLGSAGIDAACMGVLTAGRPGVIIDNRSRQAIPRIERDELARILEALDESAAPR